MTKMDSKTAETDMSQDDVRLTFGATKEDAIYVSQSPESEEENQNGVDAVDPVVSTGSCSLFSTWVGMNPDRAFDSYQVRMLEPKDIRSLNPQRWLTDAVINAYFHLLYLSRQETYIFSSFTYTLLLQEKYSEAGLNGYAKFKRYAKGITLSHYKYILFPIHQPSHWCLVIAYPLIHQLVYYDSIGGQDMLCLHLVEGFLKARGQANSAESDLDWSWTKMCIGPNSQVCPIPGQTDNHSCGLFVCALADVVTAGGPESSHDWGYSQEDMPMFRTLMRQLMMTAAAQNK
jgi:Ulp1 family protease